MTNNTNVQMEDFDINKFLEENKEESKKRFDKYLEVCKANGIDEEDLLMPTDEDIAEWQGRY